MKEIKLNLIPLKKLDPNPLNPNELNENYFEKLKFHIQRSNRYPALIVRPKGNRYEIIDGYYRYLILKELGKTEAKCEIWDVNDKETKILLATLNRLKGVDDTKKRAILIRDLSEDFLKEELFQLLPESQRTIDSFIKLAEKEILELEDEKGIIEQQLNQSGIDAELAKQMADLYQLPGTKAILKFVFDNEQDYNKAIKYFGKKGDTKKLITLLNNAKI